MTPAVTISAAFSAGSLFDPADLPGARLPDRPRASIAAPNGAPPT